MSNVQILPSDSVRNAAASVRRRLAAERRREARAARLQQDRRRDRDGNDDLGDLKRFHGKYQFSRASPRHIEPERPRARLEPVPIEHGSDQYLGPALALVSRGAIEMLEVDLADHRRDPAVTQLREDRFRVDRSTLDETGPQEEHVDDRLDPDTHEDAGVLRELACGRVEEDAASAIWVGPRA